MASKDKYNTLKPNKCKLNVKKPLGSQFSKSSQNIAALLGGACASTASSDTGWDNIQGKEIDLMYHCIYMS